MALNKLHQKDICEGSGIDLEQALKAGLESYPEQTVDDGKDSRGRAQKKYYCAGWRVPITGPVNKEFYYYRMKPDQPFIENKGKKNERAIKYLTPANESPHLFFSMQIEDWVKEVFETNEEVIITEGEKKAIKLIQEGYKAVAVSGVWCWQKNNTPIPDLDLLLKKKRRFLLCFDSDWSTNPKVKQALEALYGYILSRGGIPIFACTPQGMHKGVDDYIVAKGIESFDSYLCQVRALHSEKSEQDYEVQQAAIDMLKSPDYLTEILPSDARKLGISGEEKLLQLIYAVMASHKLDKCLGLIVKGDTSSGKTTLVNTIAQLMPNGVVEPVTGMSQQALSYWTDISNKVVIVGESRPPNDEFWEIDAVWRQLIEDDEIRRKVVIKDPHTNKMCLDTVIVKGPIAYVSTTTHPKLHEENENRLLIAFTNHNPAHIKEILQRQRDEEAMTAIERQALEEERLFIIAKHRKAIELLQKVKMVNIRIPFIKHFQFNTFGAAAARDQKKLFKLLKVITWLHSYQPSVSDMSLLASDTQSAKFNALEAQNSKSAQVSHVSPQRDTQKSVCVCQVEHYEIAYNILKDVFDSETSEIAQSLQERWEILNKEYPSSERIQDEVATFTNKDLSKILNVKRTRAITIIKQMLENKMIEEVEAAGKEKRYKCIYYSRGSAVMISPEEIADKFHYNSNKSKDKINKKTHTLSRVPFPSDTCDTSSESAQTDVTPANTEELSVTPKNDMSVTLGDTSEEYDIPDCLKLEDDDE